MAELHEARVEGSLLHAQSHWCTGAGCCRALPLPTQQTPYPFHNSCAPPPHPFPPPAPLMVYWLRLYVVLHHVCIASCLHLSLVSLQYTHRHSLVYWLRLV